MKISKLVTAGMLCASLSASAYTTEEEISMLVGYGMMTAGPTTGVAFTIVNPAVGLGLATATLVINGINAGARNYQGLEEEAIEVLAGAAELEAQPSLSLLKEELHADAVNLEEEILAETGEEISITELSDEALATLVLMASKGQN
ncbi:MAG: hypothetical protein CME64_09940 [Halobacteriovoraceae bacterium]|nr:hypothetical protein [Halobacteriovoraceae bacterium]|tara:strand:+ start:79007 stop:79444 length:438 start_codon:yes stop_codon:yes gene_type:complete